MFVKGLYVLPLLYVSTNALFCTTARKCEGSVYLNPGGSLVCDGPGSCDGITAMSTHVDSRDPIKVECLGANSCENASFELSAVSMIFCNGFQSCRNVYIEGDLQSLYLYGKNAFVGGIILDEVTVSNIYAYGDLSIDSSLGNVGLNNDLKAVQQLGRIQSDGKDVSVEISGIDPTTPMIFRCNGRSRCDFHCVDCSFNCGAGDDPEVAVGPSGSQVVYPGMIIIVDDRAKLKINCEICDDITIFAKNAKKVQKSGDGDVDIVLGPIPVIEPTPAQEPIPDETDSEAVYCEGTKECEGKYTEGRDLYCQGFRSCYKTIVKNVVPDYIEVNAYVAAQNAKLKAKELVSSSYRGLYDATVSANDVELTGYRTADRATFKPTEVNENLIVVATGVESLSGATVDCRDADYCEVECLGHDSCVDATILCDVVDCVNVINVDAEFTGTPVVNVASGP